LEADDAALEASRALLADIFEEAVQSRSGYYQKGIIIHTLLNTATFNFYIYNM